MKNWSILITMITLISFYGRSFNPCDGSFDCQTGTYTFNTNNSNLVSLTWNFGDGTTQAATITGGQDDPVTHNFLVSGNYLVIANYTDTNGRVSADTCIYQYYYGVDHFGPVSFSYSVDPNGLYTFVYTGASFTSVSGFNHNLTLNFGDGSSNFTLSNTSISNGATITTHTYLGVSSALNVTLTHSVIFNVDDQYSCSYVVEIPISFVPDPCCSNFAPIPTERYWISAWVREDHVSQVKNYTNTKIEVEFIGGPPSFVNFTPTGNIIDGWQRIVGDFVVPSGSTDLRLHLVNESTTIQAFFDDVRVHPFNASMKSYVYDPETLWLTAELDDNNYATFYEYDKEGQLIRIKKETARGIMTIQESRSSNPKN